MKPNTDLIKIADKINHLLAKGANILTELTFPVEGAVVYRDELYVFIRVRRLDLSNETVKITAQKLFLLKGETIDVLYRSENFQSQEEKIKAIVKKLRK